MPTISQADRIANSIWKFLEAEGLASQLPEVLRALRKKQLHQQKQPVVISKQPLNLSQKQKITQLLKNQYGAASAPKFQTSQEITAGLIIKFGDNIIDLTVDNALANLTINI